MKTQHLLKRIFFLCVTSLIVALIVITIIHHDKLPQLLLLCNKQTNNTSFSTIKKKNPNIDLSRIFRYDPEQYSTKLGNISGFKFLIDCNVCDAEEKIDMLFVIGSHPSHRLLRDVFREFLTTPSSNSPGMVFKTVFTFGHLQDEVEQFRLEDESAQHGDIVQGNYIDAYRNVSLRDLMGLRWAWQRCAQTRYIARIDDDIAFDIRILLKVLHKCCSRLITFMGCYNIVYNNAVYHDGVYGVSPEEYPTQCSGWQYIVTPSMAYHLDAAALWVNMIWINDVYITGSLVKELGMKHVFLDVRSTERIEEIRRVLDNGTQIYSFGPTEANATFSRQLFQFYADQSRNKSWVIW